MNAELFDKAGKYLITHSHDNLIDAFNSFCEENKLLLKDTDAFRVMDMFEKLSTVDPVTMESFKKYLEESS